MKVICVNSKIGRLEGFGYGSHLTLNKEYEVISEDKVRYYIINDSYEKYGYYKERFITTIEYRKLKLQKLNEI